MNKTTENITEEGAFDDLIDFKKSMIDRLRKMNLEEFQKSKFFEES